MFTPKYSWSFKPNKEEALFYGCAVIAMKCYSVLFALLSLVLAALTVFLAIEEHEPVSIMTLLCFVFPVFVLIFCSDHLELAFIPFVLNAAVKSINIITNFSSIFPLTAQNILSILEIVVTVLGFAFVIISLYIKLPTPIVVPIRIALWIISLRVFVLIISSSPESFESLSFVIFFMLFIGGPVKFSKINPLAMISAFVLCGIFVFGITKFLDSKNEQEKERANNSFYETCFVCDGEGEINTNCEQCNGGKYIRHNCTTCDGDGKTDSEDTCYDCAGLGYTALTCEECGGSGVAPYRSKCLACDGDGMRLKAKYRRPA